ncbi:hypothetical protein [Nitratidesulfovibrio termitidis]|uniref:hypothetical protein n=1 Tax=Nitratidesulfovibrio termitidis TaxID=42252 RepID=UPI00054DBBF7|nr:hypothetical protein [Nitratidesulfovibrio termitidis]
MQKLFGVAVILAMLGMPSLMYGEDKIVGTVQWWLALPEDNRLYYLAGVLNGLDVANSVVNSIAENTSANHKYTDLFFENRQKNQVTYAQCLGIVERYAHDHPENALSPAPALIYTTIRDALRHIEAQPREKE